MARSTIIRVTSVVTLVASFAFLWFYLHPMPPTGDLRPHEALGQVLAREALKLRGSSGRIVVVTRELRSFRVPGSEAQLRGFTRALREAGVPIATTNVIKVDPLRVAAVPPGDFLELLRRGSEQDLIVSFLGPPTLAPAHLAKLPAKHPRVIAVCSGAMPAQVDLKKIFEQDLLHAAVLSRKVPTTNAVANATAQEHFDRAFQWITAANLSELPTK